MTLCEVVLNKKPVRFVLYVLADVEKNRAEKEKFVRIFYVEQRSAKERRKGTFYTTDQRQCSNKRNCPFLASIGAAVRFLESFHGSGRNTSFFPD